MKTPLAAIRGYAETLRDGALDEPPTAARFTEKILQHCRRLQALLDDLLILLKYNQPGGQVTLRLSHQDQQAVLGVSDTGLGIPAEALPRIFERFYRVDKGRARDEGGTGLGLAIVKHVVQSHGGQVEVESRMGKGTTFRVKLPLG